MGMQGTAVSPVDPALGIAWPIPVGPGSSRVALREGRRSSAARRRRATRIRLTRPAVGRGRAHVPSGLPPHSGVPRAVARQARDDRRRRRRGPRRHDRRHRRLGIAPQADGARARAAAARRCKDLTVVSYGGPDVGLLCRAGKVREVVYAFVSLDSIALEPHFRNARQAGAVETTELDEGMFLLGLQAAAWRVPFLPTRVGLGSDVMRAQPAICARCARPTPTARSSSRCRRSTLDVALSTCTAATRAATASTSASIPTSTTCSAWPRQRRFMSVEQHRRHRRLPEGRARRSRCASTG